MKKIKFMIILILCLTLTCCESYIYEVYQNGKLINRACLTDMEHRSYSVGNTHYKLTDKKCKPKQGCMKL